MVDSQTLDEIRQRVDEFTGAARFQNSIDNLGMIDMAVFVFVRLCMEQFINDKTKTFRHGFAHL